MPQPHELTRSSVVSFSGEITHLGVNVASLCRELSQRLREFILLGLRECFEVWEDLLRDDSVLRLCRMMRGQEIEQLSGCFRHAQTMQKGGKRCWQPEHPARDIIFEL